MQKKSSSQKKKPAKPQITPGILINGPVTKRTCSDFLCFIIFSGICGGLVFIAIFGFSHGDPVAFTAPFDKFGNPCGAGENKEYPFVYFIKDDKDVIQSNQTVCIKDCPVTKTSSLQCSPDYIRSGEMCSQIKVYPTKQYVKKICLPVDEDDRTKLISEDTFNFNILWKAASDFQAAWWTIPCVGVVGVLIGFIYLMLMRFCSAIVTWGLLVFYEVGVTLFGVVCYLEAEGNPIIGKYFSNPFESLDQTTLKVIAIICFVISFFSLVIICLLKSRIKLAITVLRAAAEFIDDVNTVIFVPSVYFFVSLVFYLFWILSFIHLMGANNIVPEKDKQPFALAHWNSGVFWFTVLHFLGLAWIHTFLLYLPKFVIASAACVWYFRAVQPQKSPILLSICRSVWHLGTIAMAAVMVGFIDYIRMPFSILEKPLNAIKKGKKNCCASLCGGCSLACLKFFEAGLKFINKHALAQTAMTGKSFCGATRDAFSLIQRNSVRFGDLHGLGANFVFFGQILIVFLSTFFGYLLVRGLPFFQERLYSPWGVSLFFLLISLLLGDTFMSVYGVAADTIVHCYAMDDEINGQEGARYAPRYLKELVEKHARVIPLLKDEQSVNVD